MDFPKKYAPGIYFNLPDHEYHSDPSLSCSGIKLLLSDHEEFWDQRINPNAPEKESGSSADKGRMWHMNLMEAEKFSRKYVKGFDPDDYPDAKICDTLSELKKEMEENGLEFKSSWSTDRLLEVIEQMFPDRIIYSKDEKRVSHFDGAEIVKASDWKEMKEAENCMMSHPEFSRVFKNGHPEVSIFWIDPDTDIPCKCRIDWLKVKSAIDYKTMSLMRGSNFDASCRSKLRFESYDLQSVMYTEAIKEIKKLILNSWNEQKGWWDCVHGSVNKEFISDFINEPETKFAFVFQRTERPFSIRGLYVPERDANDFSSPWSQGMKKFTEGLGKYKFFWEKFGERKWIDDRGIIKVEDHEIYYPE